MRRRRFRVVALVLALVVPLVAVGCSDQRSQKEELLEIIEATKSKARTFSYTDEALGGTRLDVVGIIQDDYRFKSRLTIGGADVLEEIAIDDTLGMRFLDPSRVGFFLDPAKLQTAIERDQKNLVVKPGQAAVNTVPLEPLQAGRWVVDPVGAPSLVQSAAVVTVPGNDPVKDALTALDYVANIVRAALPDVRKFNRDALTPTYKAAEDDFPTPEPGARTIRYDIPLVKFPKAGAAGAGAGGPGRNQSTVPKAENFRKMAILVKDGLVVEVLEHIDVPNRLKDLRNAFDLPESTTVEQAIQAIDKVRQEQGEDEAFRPRRMRLSLTPELKPDETIELPPAGQFAAGTLAVIKGRGQQRPAGRTVPGTTPSSTVPPSTPPTDPQALSP